MKLLSTIFILSAFVLMSCNEAKSISKTEVKDTQITNDSKIMNIASVKDLVGNWEWVKTDCCGRINKTTFAKEDKPKRIIAFKKSGIARYYVQGIEGKMDEQKFTIGKLGTQSTISIGEHTPAIFTVSEDMLVLSWGYMDLQTETYKRIEY